MFNRFGNFKYKNCAQSHILVLQFCRKYRILYA
ncbi:MAG: hypothetical protein ALAOOOJD_01292 [bacterium]|nr:hypothetical protein [bacterium]